MKNKIRFALFLAVLCTAAVLAADYFVPLQADNPDTGQLPAVYDGRKNGRAPAVKNQDPLAPAGRLHRYRHWRPDCCQKNPLISPRIICP